MLRIPLLFRSQSFVFGCICTISQSMALNVILVDSSVIQGIYSQDSILFNHKYSFIRKNHLYKTIATMNKVPLQTHPHAPSSWPHLEPQRVTRKNAKPRGASHRRATQSSFHKEKRKGPKKSRCTGTCR